MIETSNPVLMTALAGLLIGLALGATMAVSRFCTMGAVADISISGDFGRMRSWLLAIAVAIIGTQIISATELISLGGTSYLEPQLFWLGAAIGGLLFGFGMVIACGCGARSLILVGRGDLRSLVAVIILGIAAYMTMRGLFAFPRIWLSAETTIDSSQWLSLPSLDMVLAKALSGDIINGKLIASMLVVTPILWFVFKDKDFRSNKRRLYSGIIVGSLVVIAWLATGWLISDSFEEVATESLSFVGPVGDSLQYLMFWTGTSINFAVAVVAGLIIGGWFAYLCRGELRLQGFEDAHEMKRYMGGGALMGIGGVLAGGCTFGQGISGVSTLSLVSIIALLAIVTGGLIGIRYLEHESLRATLSSFVNQFAKTTSKTDPA